MRGIILVSHGLYAKELKNSVEMVAGDVANVFEACLLPDEGLEQFKEKLEKLREYLKEYDEIIIFADLMGGTPCNAAISLFIMENRVSIVAGMNFPMVLTAVLTDISIEELILSGKDGIVNVKAVTQSRNIDDEE